MEHNHLPAPPAPEPESPPQPAAGRTAALRPLTPPGRYWLAGLLGSVCLAVLCWSGCKTAPVTGRRQLLLIPEAQEIQMGVTAYQETLAEETPTSHSALQDLVQRVGDRIARVAGRPEYDWEFRVIESTEANAFALPGGKVAVYEGILPVCLNEAGLAVVMSHEIAHALARHGGERMSQSSVTGVVEKALATVTKDREEKEREMILAAYGAASKYGVILPYSRRQEAEADHIGLMLMAEAGYDPAEAPRFWKRFGAMNQGEKPMEFMSTHPSDDSRSAALEDLLPEANKIYQTAPTKYGLGEVIALPNAGQ